jgi:GTPase Era involved in 16S rRNA processing
MRTQQIPYCSEVRLDRFKEQPKMIAIDATIIVMRETQKGMVIGKGGQKIKELGIAAREALQAFFDTKVYLKLSVKVDKDWRRSTNRLKAYGYQSGKE